MEFKDRLKIQRERLELTQDEMAKKLEVSRSTYSKWELGTMPDPVILKKIASFFNVSTDYLLGYSDNKDSDLPDNWPEMLSFIRRSGPELSIEEKEDLLELGKAFVRRCMEKKKNQ